MYNDSVVTTVYGPVRGQIIDDIHVFKGIRYGADTAPTRFQAPQPPEPWRDVQNAWEFGPTSPQDYPPARTNRALIPLQQRMGLTDTYPESEDCLFVNVWTPETHTGSRPVMVWVHSGGFAWNSGSSPSIDGKALAAAGDVVVVTFNHRLNVLGYTHLTDDPSSPFAGSGNAGMLDVVALLQWVRDNIAAFGGDPGNVTVFGQSGGAMKISALCAMPTAQGLFHKAILQSGAGPRLQHRHEARAASTRLMSALGLAEDDAEALQRAPLQDLMMAWHKVIAEIGWGAFGAVLDDTVALVDPFEPTTSVYAQDIPLIVGDLDTEASLFLMSRDPDIVDITAEQARARAAAAVGDAESADHLLGLIKRAHPYASPYEQLARLLSAGMFSANTDRVAVAHSEQGASVWRYRITWRTPVDDGVWLSPHELDVALVFRNVTAAQGLNGAGEDAYRLSEMLSKSWIAFAHTGTPTTPDIPVWPTYEPIDRSVLAVDLEPQVRHDVDGEELRAVQALGPHIAWFKAV